MILSTRQLTSKPEILSFLERDRLYAAYAIGDLEPKLFNQTKWVGAEEGTRLSALSLCFQGLQPPALFLMGDREGVRAIFEAGHHPQRVYVLCREHHLSTVGDFYTWRKRLPMWRMVHRPERFQPVSGNCIPLNTSHTDQMQALFGDEGADAFSPAQVQDGVFYGICDGDQLVSAAGTHLVSPGFNIAAVGNIFTHPDFRGRGYGRLTTGAVLVELMRRGIKDIVLNVEQDNIPANRLYERLGFGRYCPFFEGPAFAK